MSYEMYKIFKNIKKMLIDIRGYQDTHLKDITFEEFIKLSRNDLNMVLYPNKEHKIKNDPIYIFFPDEEKFGIKTIRSYRIEMDSKNIKRAILVIKGDITPFAKKIINEEFAQDGIIIEKFDETEFLVDITDHILVPKHDLLSIEEKEELLKKYNINDLPRILITDPQAKRYGASKKDIFKITRYSETSGFVEYYRVVS